MGTIAGSVFTLILDDENIVWSVSLGTTDPHLRKMPNLPNIQLVSAGWEHALFLDFEGGVWAYGNNMKYELGIPPNKKKAKKSFFSQVIKVPIAILVKSLVCGCRHSYFLDVDDCVWACGDNGFGQLGLAKNSENRSALQKLSNLPPIESVHSSGNFGFFLDYEGIVWATGLNTSGQLGLGHTQGVNSPTKVTTLPPIKSIACGGNHALFLDHAGAVWASGINILVEEKLVVPKKLDSVPETMAVACGWFHCVMLDVDGGVWVIGENADFQLGLEGSRFQTLTKLTNLPKIQQIGTGYYHSIFVDEDGYVWACGKIKKNFGLGTSYAAERTSLIARRLIRHQTKSARLMND